VPTGVADSLFAATSPAAGALAFRMEPVADAAV
jgi:hypothetical protein